MHSDIIIVSGLPRSGTSLLMQMLDAGGVEVVTDHVRTADTDNPRGYYELEKVKKIKQDATWLPQTRGKAFKMISQLLYDLPPGESYRILFMERDLDEILVSQEKMLQRLKRPTAPRDQIKRAYGLHLQRLHAWLNQQGNMEVLCCSYSDLIEHPQEHAQRVSDFLGGKLSIPSMTQAVDPSLYRNRNPSSAGAISSASRELP
jgi:hypothetical protein